MKRHRFHCPVCSEREGATDDAHHAATMAGIFAAAFIFALFAAVLLFVVVEAEYVRILAGR